jgi:hypothetical protein
MLIHSEIAVPTILAGIDINTNMEVIPGLYPWVKTEKEQPLYFAIEKLAILDRVNFAHPIKISLINGTKKAIKLCKFIIQVRKIN